MSVPMFSPLKLISSYMILPKQLCELLPEFLIALVLLFLLTGSNAI